MHYLAQNEVRRCWIKKRIEICILELEVETKCEQLGYAPTVSLSAAVLMFKAGLHVNWIEVKFYKVQGRV